MNNLPKRVRAADNAALYTTGLVTRRASPTSKAQGKLQMPLRVEIALLAALTVSAQQRQIGQGVNFYSTEKEIALGAHLANEVRQKTTPLNSAAALDYVEGIARRFATQLADTRFTYTMAVIADDRGGHTHEPLSLPAGYIFVPANLILIAQNEP